MEDETKEDDAMPWPWQWHWMNKEAINIRESKVMEICQGSGAHSAPLPEYLPHKEAQVFYLKSSKLRVLSMR